VIDASRPTEKIAAVIAGAVEAVVDRKGLRAGEKVG
jgi:hypothetical protein